MGIAQTGTLWRVVSTRLLNKWETLDAIGFERDVSNGTRRVETALAIVIGDLAEGAPFDRHPFAYLRANKEKLGHTLTPHLECPA
jgi:hypothetical protein